MYPVHPDFQRVFVSDHVESLRLPLAAVSGEGRLRRRAGSWLVAAGLRLAPELEPRGARVQSARATAR
jgi:hypothetical protein